MSRNKTNEMLITYIPQTRINNFGGPGVVTVKLVPIFAFGKEGMWLVFKGNSWRYYLRIFTASNLMIIKE